MTSSVPGLRVSRPRRALDIVLGTALLLLAAPILALAAFAVLVSEGRPVLFSQLRIGEDGRPFRLLKLRTMRVACPGPEVTGVHDSRVTRLGRVLRRTSLDELPQIWHVVRGQMTLVGPRPETVALAKRYPASARFVLLARPGLTGPTQLSFRERSATPPAGWDPEAWYVEHLVPRRVQRDLEFLARPTIRRTLHYLVLTGLLVLGIVEPRGEAGSVSPGTVSGTPTAVRERL